MSYFEQIDPIGESKISFEITEQTDIEKINDALIDSNTSANQIKYQLELLNELIGSLKTYSDNVFVVNKLEIILQNTANHLKDLVKANRKIYDLNTEK